MEPRTTRRRLLQQFAGGAAAFVGGGRAPARAQAGLHDRIRNLRDYVTKAMSKWEVPGLAIAIVKDGEPILAEGYGVRRLGSTLPVDVRTIFPIASCTKTFASAAIAKLMDDGKAQWDDPLHSHLPALHLFDPRFTSKVTIRHVLAHRSGLPTANMLWRRGDLNGVEIIARLRWLEPVAAPGEKLIYNNNMYLVVGKVVEQASGQKWSEFLRGKLFEPLGMKHTVADSAEARNLENVAAPHATDAGVLQTIPPHCPDSISPAGAIHSNALDLSNWITMHLAEGRFAGRQILSPARIEETHTPPLQIQDEVPADPPVPRAAISNYGLGWFFNDYAGRNVVEHSGTQTGFVSWVAMIPEERLGIIILANHHRTGLNLALRSWIFDACLGRPERDWSEVVRTDYTNGWQRLLREAKSQFDASRPSASRLRRPPSDYAGIYESKLYGQLQVTSKNSGLRIQFGTRFDGELAHWQDEGFRATFPNPRLDDWLVTFTVQHQTVTGLRVKESPWAPAWYEDADDLGEFLRS